MHVVILTLHMKPKMEGVKGLPLGTRSKGQSLSSDAGFPHLVYCISAVVMAPSFHNEGNLIGIDGF